MIDGEIEIPKEITSQVKFLQKISYESGISYC